VMLLPESVIKKAHLVVKFTHIVIFVAAGLGIMGGIDTAPTNSEDKINTGKMMVDAAKWIYLVLTGVFFLFGSYLTIRVFCYNGNFDPESVIKRNVLILVLVGVIMNVKTIFGVSTIYNTSLALEENYLYPFGVLPELLILLIYFIPRLIPSYDPMNAISASLSKMG